MNPPFYRMKCVWRTDRDAPAVDDYLQKNANWARDWLLGAIEAGVEVLPTKTFDNPPYLRLNMQRRCFYKKFPGTEAVLAFKGTEPLSAGFSEDLEQLKMERHTVGPLTKVEDYPIFEQKLPLAMRLSEALAEAEAASTLQNAFLEKYGSPAHAPIPVAVFQVPEKFQFEYREMVLKKASKRAATLIELLGTDLGVYIYYYDHLPIRVLHVPTFPNFQERVVAMEKMAGVTPTEALGSLFTTIARLLALGMMPLSTDAFGIGSCISPQNVTLKGGICDIDSVVKTNDLQPNAEKFLSVLSMVMMLTVTAKNFLLGNLAPLTWGFPDPSVNSSLLVSYVHHSLSKACARECPGVLPEYIQAFFQNPGTVLTTYLEALYPKTFNP